jgi:hypothetical protein
MLPIRFVRSGRQLAEQCRRELGWDLWFYWMDFCPGFHLGGLLTHPEWLTMHDVVGTGHSSVEIVCDLGGPTLLDPPPAQGPPDTAENVS